MSHVLANVLLVLQLQVGRRGDNSITVGDIVTRVVGCAECGQHAL